MVDYSGGDESGYKRRQVYEHSKVIELKDSRISALGAHDNVTILGNTKGYVYPYEQISDPKSSVPMFEPMNSGAKRGKESVDVIKYLPRAHVIAILIGSNL